MEKKTHWLQNPNKNYLGHWDLREGDNVVTIKSAGWEKVKNPTNGKSEDKRVVHFNEGLKPLICNQTNAKSIVKSTGARYLEDSAGLRIKLFIGETVDRKTGEVIDCVRIRDAKVEQIDMDKYYKEMDDLESLDALKDYFLALPRDMKTVLFNKKEEIKAKLS